MPFKYLTEERSAEARRESLGGQEARSAIQSHHTAVIKAAWDGPGQVAKANGAAELKYMHAWYSGSSPDEKGSYKFPHHAAGTGTPANINGVNNAKARVSNADIPSADVSGVNAHLQRHQDDWANMQKNAYITDEVRAARAAAPKTGARMMPAPAEYRYQIVEKDGKEYFELEGYATTFNQPYVMYDMFGPFMEKVAQDALDTSLSANPDVAFLVNHKGVTMARTTNGSLEVYKDLHGLGMHALLNTQRQDVKDLMLAITDKNVDQMSFAFMLQDGEWNDDFTEFTITQADIHRGDVSAVNYGANPYTSIWARAQEWAREAEAMPESVKREVMERIAPTISGVSFAMQAREVAHSHDESGEHAQRASDETRNDDEPLSRSIALYRNKLMLEMNDD